MYQLRSSFGLWHGVAWAWYQPEWMDTLDGVVASAMLVVFWKRPADGADDQAELVRVQRLGREEVGRDREGHRGQEEGQVCVCVCVCLCVRDMPTGTINAIL